MSNSQVGLGLRSNSDGRRVRVTVKFPGRVRVTVKFAGRVRVRVKSEIGLGLRSIRR